jgi:hypothetical protein
VVGVDDGWDYGMADDATNGFYSGQDADNSARPAQQPQEDIAPLGAEVTTLPPGCKAHIVNGVQLYQCGDTWYKPYFGGSGVYYEVVPQP